MNRFKVLPKLLAVVIPVVLAMALIMPVVAKSITKNLSSNFTLVNLGSGEAKGTIKYLLSDGSSWRLDEAFTITQPGGQLIKRQYDANSGLTSGRGSVIVSADQPLGAVIQLQARDGQVPTSGAYSGVSAPSDKVYVPLLMRRLSTGSGLGNSQIYLQNTGGTKANFQVQLIKSDGTTTFTKPFNDVGVGVSVEYDLEEETNLGEGWYGSAIVSAVTNGATVGVISNLFLGPHSVQTFNGFSTPARKWFAPLVMSRLANGLSTPVAVQNLSGGLIPVNGISLNCTKDTNSPGSDFSIKNNAAIGNSASFFFNPVTDLTNFPNTWFGSCVIDTTGYDTVAFVQIRKVGTDEAGAYEAIPSNGTNKKAIIPLVAKRLANGFATAVTIQNLANSQATVTLKYLASSDCAGCQNKTFTGLSIPANGSLIQNHRTDAVDLPVGWFGSLVVESTTPVDSFVQLTNVSPSATGDTFMAHNGFTGQ